MCAKPVQVHQTAKIHAFLMIVCGSLNGRKVYCD